MRVLVTGGAGFIGSHVCEALLHSGHEVAILDNLSTGKLENFTHIGERVRLHIVDIRSAYRIDEAFSEFRPDAVIHLAAQAAISVSKDDPAMDLQTNGIGTLNVLSASKEFGAKRFVLASTSAVYDENIAETINEFDKLDPRSPYGISKLAAEMYVRQLFPSSVILRFGNVYGPRQVSIGGNQVIPLMIRHILFGDKFFIHGHGQQSRDFIYVSDIASACVTSLTGEPGTYNISNTRSYSVNSLAKEVDSQFENKTTWMHTTENDPRESVCLSNRLARGVLHWEPSVEIGYGIKLTADWWKKFGVR